MILAVELAAALAAMPAAKCCAQSTSPPVEKAAEEAADKAADKTTTAPATTATDEKPTTSTDAAPTTGTENKGENKSPTNNPAENSQEAPEGKAATDGKAGEAQISAAPAETTPPPPFGWSGVQLGAIVLALFVVPIFVGNYLAKAWKMPDHGWKFSLVLGVLAGSIVICTLGTFKFGPDLAGGITLIYELQDAPVVSADDPNQPANNGDAKQIRSGDREFSMDKLLASLKERIDPDGTKEITVRPYGQAVEIIIPQVAADEMDFVKEKITKLGQLEFRITADPTVPKDRTIIDLAKQAPPMQKEIKLGDAVVARWVPYDVEAFGPVDSTNFLVKRMAGDTAEALVLIDPLNVTGDYLTRASSGFDEHGAPAVDFQFNSRGAQRFEKLTGQNLPNPANPDKKRNLGIILDNKLENAPSINSKISDRGQISGDRMTNREVELTVQVLDAGSLPAALNKKPISEEVISPTLGGQTVEQGKRAIVASLIGVAVFMVVYYHFAGIVACLALAINLLMVLALMVLIKAAFTLPGLAGLALTVGMSVDANVLIYERIREELANGAALRMAIRNGFSRAMSAIVDSNLTTIISGIVLFYIGTDQVKGFAITLVLGILTSMFSAIFVARLIFDVAERRGWISQLSMLHIFTKPNYNFLKYRWAALFASWLLIGVGLVAVYFRGSSLLDIDFTGGTSVTFTLNDKDKMPLGDVRDAMVSTALGEKNLVIVERGENSTSFTVDTSEQSVDSVKKVIEDKFGKKLKRFSFQFDRLQPFTEGNLAGTEAQIIVNGGPDYKEEGGMSLSALRDQIVAALAKKGHAGVAVALSNPNYIKGSSARFNDWTARFADLDEATTRGVLEQLQGDLQATALFPLASTIGGRVSSNMQFQALLAVAISLVAMIIYLWLRFQKPSYGIAAGVALIHDVLVTIGMIALSAYIVNALPGFANALMIDSFQINLTIVAALLTIIGFSVNDTIVTFDRLREIKGKSPQLTAKMVNESVNQTLGRTILTVFTVFIVVLVMYIFGGDGLHSFAFAFLVGVFIGTYSSVYIAAPVLLWLSGVSAEPASSVEPSARNMQPAR
ncbi:MAG: protein translocase subunit SecD [Pirellulales bacterium]|nr:protein translocase subunit SecD [Pirellulales bacterium]